MTIQRLPAGASSSPDQELFVARAEEAAAIAARHAEDVDRRVRFPSESVAALKERGLFAAVIPPEYGGPGAGPETLSKIATTLARACGATAMIWAMHQIQAACLARHHGGSSLIENILRNAAARQWLIASVTSERGNGGDLGVSEAAVRQPQQHDSVRTLEKHATTISYGAEAQALLATARRTPDSPPTDQVAVIIYQGQATLSPSSRWNPLGMKGTCSPGFQLTATFEASQILATPFHHIASATMVPLSHILWASVWIGLAEEALSRATCYSRKRLAQSPDEPTNPALSEAHWRLRTAQALHAEVTAATAAQWASASNAAPRSSAQLNALKVSVSESCLDVANLALRICGMAGYAEEGPYSVSRLLRDLLSGPLMIGNSRLLSTNANLILLDRE